MASKILSFICYVPSIMPGAYPTVPMTGGKKADQKKQDAGHFAAIYENERFVRFKYIRNA
jgi:hypothetical protein